MSRQVSISVSALSALALTTICLLSSVNIAHSRAVTREMNPNSIAVTAGLDSVFASQKGPEVVAGAPLKGVDVKLGRPPGGSPAARTTTDSKGKFSFGVVPAGSYILTLDLSDEAKNTRTSDTTAKEKSLNAVNVKLARIEIEGAVGGKRQVDWDFTTKRQYQTLSNASKASAAPDITVESNGHDPLNGICQQIIKSKSNITNN